MWSARARLLLLWLSQIARILADWILRLAVFLELRRFGSTDSSAWHLVTAVYIAPFVLLAPLHGSLSNALPRRWVLSGACLIGAAAIGVFLVLGGPWLAALGTMAIGSALFSTSRYAMLPAVAQDAQVPLTRVTGLIELGGVSAILGGIILGLSIEELNRAVVVVLGLNLAALATALFCSFPSDRRRPEPPLRALAGFFRDCRRIHAEPTARYSLVTLSLFQGVVTAGSGAVFTQALDNAAGTRDAALHSLLLVTVGVVLGCGLAALQVNTRRSLALVPLGLTGLALAQGWAALAGSDGIAPTVPSLLLGLMGGLLNVALRSNYQAAVPADARGNAMSVMNTVIFLTTAAVALVLVGLAGADVVRTPAAQLWLLAATVLLGALLAWKVLLTHVCELLAELLLLPLHSIHLHGPGVGRIPVQGPLLLVANHSTYFDPFWLAKLSPRRVRPLMTARFFDLPVIRWLMVHVVQAIRVPRETFRREAPELDEVIAELKRGGCVMIFPEAILRRSEEKLLRQFGQGVWRVLREAPLTPVVVFWIEGGWGSWASYKDGPPMKNKKFDCRRRIDIVIEEAQVLPADVLADQRLTRRYLMEACLGARRRLGLETHSIALETDESN